jgi:hypothetical protein
MNSRPVGAAVAKMPVEKSPSHIRNRICKNLGGKNKGFFYADQIFSEWGVRQIEMYPECELCGDNK